MTPTQTDQQLREKVFRKMGFVCILYPQNVVIDPDRMCWTNREKTVQFKELSPIETSWEVCAEYLVPFMRERGITWRKYDSLGMEGCKEWFVLQQSHSKNPIKAEIHNDNIALAACEAFMEVDLD